MPNYKDFTINYQGGNLVLNQLKLKSLAGCPEHITGDFKCNYNIITSLVGGPQRVDGSYDCRNNELTSLEGCASHIGDILLCTSNLITTLVGIHKIVKSCNKFSFRAHKISMGGIGLLLIDNLELISASSIAFGIIRTYLGTGTKGMMECRKELISKGYDNHAKL